VDAAAFNAARPLLLPWMQDLGELRHRPLADIGELIEEMLA